ncbi:MAG: amidase [Burkholderiales bacterium]
MKHTLTAARERIRAGQTSAAAEIERSIEIAQSPACDRAFLRTTWGEARAVAGQAGVAERPLAGLAVSIKDLFDIAGQTTAAGSTLLADAPPATADCPAVARLKAAGGAILGRTNMTEFAFSGVGTNPHFGTPANPCDPATARIPGGSSSGAAVSVASGAAFIGLGSDTGGSIRIPAALCGIVGFKNTQRLVPTTGALPLSTTLDTACAMTRSVGDAIVAHEILSGRKVVRAAAPLSAYRFAVARTTMLDGLDAGVARAFERALQRLRAAGATVDEIALAEIADLGSIQATGGFTAAESFAWHRAHLADPEQRRQYDPRVAGRIDRGANMLAWEYVELLAARSGWIRRVEAALAGYDAVLSPTVPIVAPPIASLAPAGGKDAAQDKARDAEFARINPLLLRNPSVVNMLDGCALSIPCHAPGELPVGLMLWHGPMRDDAVLTAGLAAERSLCF